MTAIAAIHADWSRPSLAVAFQGVPALQLDPWLRAVARSAGNSGLAQFIQRLLQTAGATSVPGLVGREVEVCRNRAGSVTGLVGPAGDVLDFAEATREITSEVA